MTSKKQFIDELEVYLDLCNKPKRIGMLGHEHGQIRFEYDPAWIQGPDAFKIDPSLDLTRGPYFPDSSQSNFGIFLDSAPDRWGQKIMERRERLTAIDEGRQPRALTAWDFLMGVQDATRMGALRFKAPGDTPFLDNHPLPAPPLTSLAELQDVAQHLSRPNASVSLDRLRQWLSVLVAPGASLGGAHPKANFRQVGGELWIAKFPARDDLRDNALWEKLIHDMARDAGIAVPPSKLERFGKGHHTFCVQRFDRTPNGARRFFISAMTAMGKKDGTEGSYLDLAQFIQDHALDDLSTRSELAQLFRRIVFNVQAGNRDDHLRNHGFVFEDGGWRLAHAFDLNPSFDKLEHVLSFDGRVHAPDMEVILSTAEYYGLERAQAVRIVEEVGAVTESWRQRARKLGISGVEMAEAEHLLPKARVAMIPMGPR